jgi:hypothetical protein
MLRRDALIASQDALSGETIAVQVQVQVQVQVTDAAALTEPIGWEVQWIPASTVVYARAPKHEHEHECGVDAASACCPVMIFFSAEAHVHAWAETHPVVDGVLLTQVEAIRYAHELYGGLPIAGKEDSHGNAQREVRSCERRSNHELAVAPRRALVRVCGEGHLT